MNPLDFFFNGAQSNASSWFGATTQGVSSFSSGVNPAALEAQVDFGGTPVQYSTINQLTLGTLMGLFGDAIGNVGSQILSFLTTAAQLYLESGGG